MKDNRVLSDEQRDSIEKRAHILYSQGGKKLVEAAISDAEQAVLQSPEVVAMRRDAERWRYWCEWFETEGMDSDEAYPPRVDVIWHKAPNLTFIEALDAAMEKKP